MSPALRLLSVPVVVAVVAAGIWVAGGVVTNDFALAAALTTAWMAVSGLGCALIAWRRRDLRVPVLGAYLLTAAVAAVYLGRSQLVDDVVDERVVMASMDPTGSSTREPERNVLLSEGMFVPVEHAVRGTARVIRTPRGRVLTLTGFEVDNGPDLRVYLVRGPARDSGEVADFEDLGALKGNRGDQQYAVPGHVTPGRRHTVVIWCRAFSVNFARAPLT